MTRREKSGALTARVVQSASQRACRVSDLRDSEQTGTFTGATSLIYAPGQVCWYGNGQVLMRWLFLFAVHVTGRHATKGDGFSLLDEGGGGLVSAAGPV